MLDQLLNILDSLSVFFKTPSFKTTLLTFKFIFYIVSFAFIGLSIWLRYKSFYFAELKTKYSFYLPKEKKKERSTEGLTLQNLRDYWTQLALRLNYQDEAQWKLAVIEADNLFDHVLTLLGYQGESMGERLQKIKPEDFRNLNDVWQVHKIRNALVHDPTFSLSYQQADNVIKTYEKALKELKILE